ncbi:hypothetical protein BDF20DRAFT_874074 [Mycotypha africana]|uniref:uncharacterized protein n=1 Tax=Mycotypha africana TaxID=64632 RepID=UPI002300EE7D|nr:uncharacterized protein BDF20DRAFT_874074 [Mycotypha africana]KAI8977307.1 hypothetical protein BDF20DRAFT_874074 [Mycotypha africana]
MDFSWVDDRQNNYIKHSTSPSSGSSSIRLSNDMDINTMNTRLAPSAPFSTSQDSSAMSPLRRSRADTMPSQSSVFPYASDLVASLNNAKDTTSTNSSNSNIVGGLPSTSLRHRSGSVTLPHHYSHMPLDRTAAEATSSSSHVYDPSSPMDENATSTIASTLASLGLDDNTTTANGSATTASSLDHSQHPIHRGRSYTITGPSPLSSSTTADLLASSSLHHQQQPSSRLTASFNPFSPHARSNLLLQQNRPRAISLNMGEMGTGPFSPFMMSSPTSSHLSTPNATGNTVSAAGVATGKNAMPSSRLRMQHNATDSMSANNSLYSSNRLEKEQESFHPPDDLLMNNNSDTSPSSLSNHQAQLTVPSRALWLGNINPSISVADLTTQFSIYGQVESARILSDKECAFVNFLTVESAIAAKNDLETRLGSKLGGTPVRVGFGKADVNLAMALTNDTGPNAQGPTRALWVGNIPANMNANVLRNIFGTFGVIESVRVLSHKNCGFINFEHQEDAVRARKALQNKEILGAGTGTVRIGFAKVPSPNASNEELNDESRMLRDPYPLQPPQPQPQLQPQPQPHMPFPAAAYSPQHLPPAGAMPYPIQPPLPVITNNNDYQAAQWATAIMMTNMMLNASGQQQTTQPSLYKAIASERQLIMQQLGQEPSEKMKEDRVPLTYITATPVVPEWTADRKLEPLRLREMRKKLESEEQQPNVLEEVEAIAAECMDEIVELCSDYIGNTVIQKLFELCSEETKLKMLEKIAPYLASIGVHKNGTWAAQKIIDFSNTPEQIQCVRQHIAPYVPLLLLDQFGNYVVQCCLRKGSHENQYIFDAIVDKCWEIGQGRFGARAVRSILESSIVTKEQQVYVAAAIVQNTVLLTTNANGILLLNWFLDTSGLPERYRVLCPRLLPYLNKLSSHKLGSLTVSKIVQQQEDAEASNLLLNSLTEKARADILSHSNNNSSSSNSNSKQHHTSSNKK